LEHQSPEKITISLELSTGRRNTVGKMLKFEFALTLLFILGILTSAKRELLVSKSELSYSYSYSYEDELIGYVTTNVYLFNENQDYDLWVNVIDSTDTELSGEYLEKIVYGEYGTFT